MHLNLALDPAKVEAHWAEDRTLPPIDIRSPGIGQTEFAISDASQLAASRQLIRLAYDRFAAPELADGARAGPAHRAVEQNHLRELSLEAGDRVIAR